MCMWAPASHVWPPQGLPVYCAFSEAQEYDTLIPGAQFLIQTLKIGIQVAQRSDYVYYIIFLETIFHPACDTFLCRLIQMAVLRMLLICVLVGGVQFVASQNSCPAGRNYCYDASGTTLTCCIST